MTYLDCVGCDWDVCSEECFELHPGSIIALNKVTKHRGNFKVIGDI